MEKLVVCPFKNDWLNPYSGRTPQLQTHWGVRNCGRLSTASPHYISSAFLKQEAISYSALIKSPQRGSVSAGRATGHLWLRCPRAAPCGYSTHCRPSPAPVSSTQASRRARPTRWGAFPRATVRENVPNGRQGVAHTLQTQTCPRGWLIYPQRVLSLGGCGDTSAASGAVSA